MKAKDLRERSSADLKELRATLTRELFQNRMKNAVGQLENTSAMGKARKDIARIEGILSQREGEQA
jgi:large subunit ribosomal protein L29